MLVSPAGTIPDPGSGVVRMDGDRILLGCSGLVLTHADYTLAFDDADDKTSREPDPLPVLVL